MKLTKLRATTLALVSTVALAAAGGACSATGDRAAAGSLGTGAAGATGSAGTASGGNGGSLLGNGGSTGTLALDAGTPTSSSTGSGGPPPVCDPGSCTAAGGQCQGSTCAITENPGNVSATVQATLQTGGTADMGFGFLYPYNHTVFPRGLLSPTIQLKSTVAALDATYVHISAPGLEYKGFYGASNPGRIVFAPAVWTAITLASTGAPDSIDVEVTESSGGKVSGPINESWTIATGSLRGTIYYETYGSAILGGPASVGIMQIQPGASTPTVVKSGCGNICHTASADGSTLVASQGFSGITSASYDLKNNATQIYLENGDGFVYGGIYPDGSFVMSATNFRTWFSNPSRLYDTKTGANIPAPGWDATMTNGGTPAFSPDGTKIVFNHEDTGGGHSLAVMDFDLATKTFSNLVEVASDPANTLGWPAFTPDSKSVVYHAGSSDVFETDADATGDLYYTDVATQKVTRLDALDGYTNGKVYLPANDPQLSFAPTVLPEAVGGYFWVVFTSHRSYGNTLPSKDNGDQNGKLWVAAFDLNPTPGKDPSHPAFFLDGQETVADNLRGFWVLNPCSANSNDCTSGDDCCGGFCRQVTDGGPLQCVPPPGGCSNEFESCKTAADCCDPGYQCINSHCAQPPTQ